MATSGNRTVYLDFIRFIAIPLVIFNHTNDWGFTRFAIAEGGINYILWLFASIACKVNVPLFFMVSGAVLLGKDEPYRRVLRKRVLRFALVLAAFTFLQFYIRSIQTGMPMNLRCTLLQFLEGRGTVTQLEWVGTFWFLYAYLAILLFLPFLRILAAHMRREHFRLLATLCIVLGGLFPILLCLLNHGQFVKPDILKYTSFLSWWILYPLLGYYLARQVDIARLTKRGMWLLGSAALFAIVLTMCITWFHLMKEPSLEEMKVQVFHKCLVILPACFLFLFFRKKMANVRADSFSGRLFIYLGGLSFCVMLLEENARTVMRECIFPHLELTGALRCLVYVVGAYLLAAAAGAILKLIPGVKRLL
ncbi:MAG: acyltransferase [Akkermansia sp.]